MACGSCGKKTEKYVWTSEDGEHTIIYDSKIVAQAKVQRKGGSYKPKEG